MFSSWGLLRLIRLVYGRFDVEILSLNIILAVYLQFILSLTMFYEILPIHEFIVPLTMTDEATLNAIENTPNRLHGIGTNFFTLGVINCCTILLATAVLIHTENKCLKKFYFVSIVIFLVVGMLMARTTLLSVPIIMFYYICNNKKNVISLVLSLFNFTIVSTLLFFIFQKSIIIFFDENEMLLRFGFEHFYNFFEGNGFTSESTSELATLFILPDNLMTWIIGDARIINSKFPQFYYMNTDIGYCRALFYFGVIGLIPLLLLYFSLFKSAAIRNRKYSSFFYFLFFMFLLLFYKGICNLLFLGCLFLFTETSNSGSFNKGSLKRNVV